MEQTPKICLGVQVLWKGYLSDRAALANKLSTDAHDEDWQLLAYAFRAWGAHLQAHVLGEYAAFIYDPQTQTGLLTHDALGVAPVYYQRDSRNFSFATNLVDLLDADNTANLDREYFADYLARGYVASERTPFPSIKRLLPGRSLQSSPRELRSIQGWDLAGAPQVRYAEPQQYQENFNALLADAVRSTTATSGNTWVALSGGLDSASVACVAAQQQVRGLTGYSLIYPNYESADEQPWMRATVEHCGIPWHPVDIETVLPFTRLPDEFIGEPSLAMLHVALRRTEQKLLAEQGATLLLTGDGGDSILATSPGSSPTHLADALFRGRPHETKRVMDAWRTRTEDPRAWSYWMSRTVLTPALQHLLGRQIRPQMQQEFPPWMEHGYIRDMRMSRRGRERLANRCSFPSQQVIADSLWCVALSLNRGQPRDRGYATRYPLLYRPLVEFMFDVPWEEKLHPRCDRYLQRRAMKGLLPELVRRRAYKAVGTWGFVEGLRRSPVWIDYLCENPLIVDLGITTAEHWRTAIMQASLGQTHGDRFFLTAAATEAWLKGLQSWRRNQQAATVEYGLPHPDAIYQ